jgi:F-type H+-transporting ATPase subunit delta
VPSATREALVTARRALAGATPTAATGPELLAAARAIGGNSQLRSALADPSREVSERQTLSDRAFAGLGDPARAVLRAIAGARWSDPAHLVEGVEEVGVRALVVAAPAGTRIEDELFAVGSTVSGDAELELAVGSKLVGPEPKLQLVDRLFAGKVGDETLQIVRHLVQRPGRHRMAESLRWAQDVVADASDVLVATVTVAAPLPAEQTARLESALGAQYDRTVRTNQIVDPRVLGGVRVQIGDDVIDGTVAARLADLRLQLAG